MKTFKRCLLGVLVAATLCLGGCVAGVEEYAEGEDGVGEAQAALACTEVLDKYCFTACRNYGIQVECPGDPVCLQDWIQGCLTDCTYCVWR